MELDPAAKPICTKPSVSASTSDPTPNKSSNQSSIAALRSLKCQLEDVGCLLSEGLHHPQMAEDLQAGIPDAGGPARDRHSAYAQHFTELSMCPTERTQMLTDLFSSVMCSHWIHPLSLATPESSTRSKTTAASASAEPGDRLSYPLGGRVNPSGGESVTLRVLNK